MGDNIEEKKWSEVLRAIETTHNLTTRGICQLMKVSRSWVNKYIVPHIKDTRIYLPIGIRKDGKNAANWVKIAATTLDKPTLTEQNWYCREDFMKLIKSSIYSVTRQTISVPVEIFVEDKEELSRIYSEIENEFAQFYFKQAEMTLKERYKKLRELSQKKATAWTTLVSEEDWKIVEAGLCSEMERKKVEHIPVQYNVIDYINEWVAPHDIRTYGDTDEQIYRKLFSNGYIRIELKIPDKESSAYGKLVYYLKDPHPLMPQYVNMTVPFAYSCWQMYVNHSHLRRKP